MTMTDPYRDNDNDDPNKTTSPWWRKLRAQLEEEPAIAACVCIALGVAAASYEHHVGVFGGVIFLVLFGFIAFVKWDSDHKNSYMFFLTLPVLIAVIAFSGYRWNNDEDAATIRGLQYDLEKSEKKARQAEQRQRDERAASRISRERHDERFLREHDKLNICEERHADSLARLRRCEDARTTLYARNESCEDMLEGEEDESPYAEPENLDKGL